MNKRWFDILTIALLFNLAVAHPLFQVLQKSPEFFVARHSRPFDVVLLVLLVCLIAPALLVFIESLTIRIRIYNTVHKVLLFLLTTLLALPLLKQMGLLPGFWILLLAFLIAIALLLVFKKSSVAKSTLQICFVLILVIPVLFLTSNSLSQILHPQRKELSGIKVQAPAPVVFIIFDEFPVTSLLDADSKIDSKKYPNFARLQRDAFWFRNATTVSDATPMAVPAILTGNYPSENKLPVLKDYPNNLFTMLAGSNELQVFENITELCPKDLNATGNIEQTPPERIGSMLTDVTAVYLHIVTPDDMQGNLPPINEKWGNFWQAGDHPGALRQYNGRDEQFHRFLTAIKPSSKPVLYFQHILLPHVPWEYLPDGKFYDYRGYGPMGIEGTSVKEEHWIADNWVVNRAYQRHLLQVGYVDYLIGQLIDRLKSQNLYDQSLIVITADHGQSFRAGDRARTITPTNYPDIVFVPLFLKLPGQHEGKIIDREFQTIDILPTIADALAVTGFSRMDGASGLRDHPDRPKKKFLKSIFTQNQWLDLEPDINMRTQAVLRKIAIFSPSNVERYKALNQLKPQEALRKSPKDVLFQLKDPSLFENVDLHSNSIPIFVTGQAFFANDPKGNIPIGIWINGVFRGMTRTFQPPVGDLSGWFKTLWFKSFPKQSQFKPEYCRAFGMIVEETAFRQGKNEIQIVNLQNWSGP